MNGRFDARYHQVGRRHVGLASQVAGLLPAGPDVYWPRALAQKPPALER